MAIIACRRVHRFLAGMFINFQLVAFSVAGTSIDLLAINTRSRSIRERAHSKHTDISLAIVCIHGFNCSLVQSHPPLLYLSARIKCGDGRRRRRRATPLLLRLSFIAQCLFSRAKWIQCTRKGQLGVGQEPARRRKLLFYQHALYQPSPSRPCSHPPAALENWIWVRALGAF